MASPTNTVDGLLGKMVEKMATPCWVWQGVEHEHGFGSVSYNSVSRQPHRIIYEQFHGTLADGLVLHQLCRNKHCVNPEHLKPVTMGEAVKTYRSPPGNNARKSHCLRGHELAGGNLYVTPGDGSRQCRICKAMRNRQRRQKKKD